MPVFRYTFKKILLTPSTWIIFAISVLFLLLAWSLPLLLSSTKITDVYVMGYVEFWKDWSFSILVSVLLFVFIAIKSTQVFRDEIDDGTLLILVSKPVSRNRIWTEKLLSLQLVIILYLFLAILIPTLFIAIPGVGGWIILKAIFPYVAILFGVALIFNLIISPVAILFSLLLNSKALIAIMIGMAAIFNIFANIASLIQPNPNYIEQSRAKVVFNTLKSEVDNDDMKWVQDQFLTNYTATITKIEETMKLIYQEFIQGVHPNTDATKEQAALKSIVIDNIDPQGVDVTLAKHIYYISNVFRQTKLQTIKEIMIGNNNKIHPYYSVYSVADMINALNQTFTLQEYNDMNTSIKNTKIMRYLNIFYQLKYIWTGTTSDKVSIFTITYSEDPYLVNFIKTGNSYKLNLDDTNHKIINLPALLVVYILLGIILIGISWIVFNRKDFV